MVKFNLRDEFSALDVRVLRRRRMGERIQLGVTGLLLMAVIVLILMV